MRDVLNRTVLPASMAREFSFLIILPVLRKIRQMRARTQRAQSFKTTICLPSETLEGARSRSRKLPALVLDACHMYYLM